MKIRALLTRLFDDRHPASLLSLFTPRAARDRSLGERMLLAGGTLAATGVALAMATTASTLLLLAIGVLYYLLTQVLGFSMELDPASLTPWFTSSQRAAFGRSRSCAKLRAVSTISSWSSVSCADIVPSLARL